MIWYTDYAMEKHLQIITCRPDNRRVIKILHFFAKKSFQRGLTHQLFLDPDTGKVYFVLYAEKIFDMKLNLETVIEREKFKKDFN